MGICAPAPKPSAFLHRFHQNPVHTNIAARMNDVRAAYDSNALGIPPQGRRLSPEVRIVRIDGPHNFSGKTHDDFQSSSTHLANDSPVAFA